MKELEETLRDIELQKKIEESEISDNNRESSVKVVRNNDKEIQNEKVQYLPESKRKKLEKSKRIDGDWGDPLRLSPSKAINSVHLQKALMK